MSTPYEPTGQVAPVPEITLPQDVIDLVVAESVNNPFVGLADNVAWLLLMFAATGSVKNYGAVGDGVANDTTAIDDALAARLFVFFPEGTYRTTGDHELRNGAVLFGVPDLSIVALGHPTNHFWVLASNNTKARFVDLRIEGMQTNTGGIFRTTGTVCAYTLERVTVNADSYLHGVPINGAVDSIRMVDSVLHSEYVGAAFSVSGRLVYITGGELHLAPASPYFLVGATDRCVINDVYFSHISTLGGQAFIDSSSGIVSSDGCTFYVDDDAAGDGTSAFRLNNGIIHTSNVTLLGATNYKLATKAALGSKLELVPAAPPLTSGSSAFTMLNGYESQAVDATNAAPPTITLPRILFIGQRYALPVQNGSAGNWTGAFVLAAQVGDGIIDAPAEFDALLQGRVCLVDFVAVDHFGDVLWIQAGASVQV